MSEDPRTVCPECNKEGLVRKISAGGGIIIKGRQANQYNDCRGARTWRDKNGNLHEVSSSDGSYKSPTATSKQYRSKDQVEAMKKRDAQIRSKRRQADSYNRFAQKQWEAAKKMK